MALTVVKYRKTATGETSATPAILIKSKLQPSNIHNKNVHNNHQQHQRSLLDINKVCMNGRTYVCMLRLFVSL